MNYDDDDSNPQIFGVWSVNKRKIRLPIMRHYAPDCFEIKWEHFVTYLFSDTINPLNAELNPIRHLLALAGAHHFVHVSRIRVNYISLDVSIRKV
jgi:hypothetical protein